MNKSIWASFLFLFSTHCGKGLSSLEILWQVQTSGVTASLRGLCAVDSLTAWASGSAGTVIRTLDGGNTWVQVSPAGYDSLDFRDIQAFDESRAVTVSAGSPAVILMTEDGGQSWTKRYQAAEYGIFFDAMDFQDPLNGIAFSDPVGGKFYIVRTTDGGSTWNPLAPDDSPDAMEGEAGFAASGTCLAGKGHTVWIGTGGGAARVLRSRDRGTSWSAFQTPMTCGSPSRGIFSVSFLNKRIGIAVGGDFAHPDLDSACAAYSLDAGRSWRNAERNPAGYRSCVVWIESSPRAALAVGTTGSDMSLDYGKTWSPADSTGYHAVAAVPGGRSGWASGAGGRIARWTAKSSYPGAK